MGHTRRVCRIARLRREGGNDYTQDEEERVKAHLRREFNESPIGIRWATHQREWEEHRERVTQRYREAREREREEARARQEEREARERQRDVQRDVLALGLPRPEPAPIVDLAHSFSQIISWARRAERESRSQIRDQLREVLGPKALSLKMIDDFNDYVVEEECAICYDAVPTVGLPCKHTFCCECTKKSARTRNTCPLCREEFSEIFICRNISPEEFNKVSTTILL